MLFLYNTGSDQLFCIITKNKRCNMTQVKKQLVPAKQINKDYTAFTKLPPP